MTSTTLPDSTEILPTYNEANLLEAVDVKIRGSSTTTPFVRNVDYNARGQRTLIEYAGSSSAAFTTEYAYDTMTFRLSNQSTTRASDSAVLQDSSPIYDPVGNIVELVDDADQSLYFNDTSAPALVANAGQYGYDPLYRLTSATGREHPGQGPVADSEVSASTIPHPNDSSAMRAYVESYSYDEVGNILEIDHDCSGTTYDWTRTNTYASGNNKLATSQITGSSSFTYTHDDRGNMTAMPHLSSVGWDYADRMQTADLGGGGDVYFTYDWAGQRVRKVWDKSSALRDERIYLGAFELWRESTVSGGTASVQEERQTVHVMDDVRRVAMVETKTVTGGSTVSSPTPRQRYQLGNHLESASVELTETGSIISYEEYFPFGATSFRSADGSGNVSAKRYRYTGKERDEETALYYHGARYYAPWLGRWTAVDPAGNAFGTRYGYVGNHPIHAHDPDGRDEVNRSTSTRPNAASTLDRSDPRNYSSFEEYAQNAALVSSSSTTPEQLRKNWDAAQPASTQQASTTPAVASHAKPPETSLGVLLEQGGKVLGGETTLGRAALTTAEAHAINIVTSIPNVAVGVALYKGVQATREAYAQAGAARAAETGVRAYGSYLWGLVPVLPTVMRIGERIQEAQSGEATTAGTVGDVVTLGAHALTQLIGIGVGVKEAGVEVADSESLTARLVSEETGGARIGLPAFEKLTVEWQHIFERHKEGGPYTAGRTIFPSTMSELGIQRAVREAYRVGEKVAVTDDERVVLRGQAAGLTIDIWYNRATQTIETAYPITPRAR